MELLASSSASATQLYRIDLSQSFDLQVLGEAVRDVFVPSFKKTSADLLENVDIWQKRNQDPNVILSVLVAGSDVFDNTKRKMTAFALGSFYKAANAGLLDYNASIEKGIGGQMRDARIKIFNDAAKAVGQTQCQGIYTEVENSEIFTRSNAIIVPIGYTQMSLSKELSKSDDTDLLQYPRLDGTYAPPKVTSQFLHALAGHYGTDPSVDKDSIRMDAELFQIQQSPACALAA